MFVFSILHLISINIIGSSIPTSTTIISELPFLIVLFGSIVILALLFRYLSGKSSK